MGELEEPAIGKSTSKSTGMSRQRQSNSKFLKFITAELPWLGMAT